MEILRGLLPIALFAACPLAMLIMMRGMHGGHGRHEDHGSSNTESDPATATRLAAMEQEITRLRGQIDAARSANTVVPGGKGGRG